MHTRIGFPSVSCPRFRMNSIFPEMIEFEFQSMNEPCVPARWREAYEWKQADGDKEEEKVKKTKKIPTRIR